MDTKRRYFLFLDDAANRPYKPAVAHGHCGDLDGAGPRARAGGAHGRRQRQGDHRRLVRRCGCPAVARALLWLHGHVQGVGRPRHVGRLREEAGRGGEPLLHPTAPRRCLHPPRSQGDGENLLFNELVGLVTRRTKGEVRQSVALL